MNSEDSLVNLIEQLKRRAPELVDLFCARTQQEFEDAFLPLLEKAIEHLETNKVKFQGLDEEALSAVLVAALSMPGLTVTRETNSNGHVDITVTADHSFPIRRKLGEAKIYRGPAYHVGGLQQLLGRYTTGRESYGFVITYVQQEDIAGLIKKLRNRMDVELPENQMGMTTDHKLKWSFSSVHGHSCGNDLQVDHVGCNLHVST